MPIQTVQHIADVSLKNHFFQGTQGPVSGKIMVNHNTFDVTFDQGTVRAKFASGNAFANWFRSGTLSRFTRTLQEQYNAWIADVLQNDEAQGPLQVRKAVEQPRIPAAPKNPLAGAAEEPPQAGELEGAGLGQAPDFDDNPDAAKVPAVVDEFKAVLNEADPPGKNEFLRRLDDIATLASLRNTLSRNPSAAACDAAVRSAGFLTHYADNTGDLDEKGKKAYVLNMLDTVVNGLLQAAEQMKDKRVQVVDFLRKFDGACVEAKIDNIQDWLARDAGVANAAHSDSSHDLAYSITVEFEEIAKEIRKPFEDEARAACEAEVRADCEKKGIADEDEIKEKIDAKVAILVMKKDGEIAPKIQEAIREKGKFRLYSSLAGALRPVTEIAKDETTGIWTVTTLVDKAGKPVLKPVSAHDIDRNFEKMVKMYGEEAIVMGLVENKTAVEEPVYATREDYRRDGVMAKLEEYRTGKADVAELARLVKAEIPYDLELGDEELKAKVEHGLVMLAGTDKGSPAMAKKAFFNFVNFYADSTYLDKKDDLARLVHLLARHTETCCSRKKMLEARIANAADRCAQMMANAFGRYKVDLPKLKGFVEATLSKMVAVTFGPDRKAAGSASYYLNKIMPNGVLFADSLLYDIGHRAAGAKETMLGNSCKIMAACIKHFTGVHSAAYMTPLRG